MNVEATQLVKVCASFCGLPRPLNEFRLRSAGSDVRHSDCASCHARSERLRRAHRQHRQASSLAAELSRVTDRDDAVRVCRMLLSAFGGTLGVARALWECHRSAEPGSPTAARVLLGIANLQRVTAPPSLEHEMAMKNDWLP
jgi:hypothetical protein